MTDKVKDQEVNEEVNEVNQVTDEVIENVEIDNTEETLEKKKSMKKEPTNNKAITTTQMESKLIENREMSMGVWHMINAVANDVYHSRLFAVGSPQQASAIMLKGYEIGLGLMASFEFVQVVKGHVGLSPKGALALLHNSPKISKIELKRLTDEHNKFVGYECTMKRVNGFQHTERWELEDAVTAQLMKPDSNWEKYPENMCKWRAIGFCADVVAPDVTAGMVDFMIRPEQFGVALDNEGNIIEGAYRESSNRESSNQVTNTQPPVNTELVSVTLEELLDRYSAEEIMQANGGLVPGTSEELERVSNRLIQQAQEGGN